MMSGDEAFRSALTGLMQGPILFNEAASRHTSIGVGGPVDAIAFPEDEEELRQVVGLLRAQQVAFLPVGNWTNLIVRDGGYRGVLVSLARLRSLSIRDEAQAGVEILAGAGCPLAELVALSAREALTGLEFGAGIPGSLGGAVRMNAGAFGTEMKDILESARILDRSGEIRDVLRQDLSFTYRNLDLPAETIIIGAAVRLFRGERERIDARIREIMGARRDKHPLDFPSAGSVFKNPRGCPAGRLIEEAGLKGMRIGGAQIAEKHGNFIINRGQATAEEILNLIELARQRVFERSGLALETEVKIIGE